MIIGIKLNPPLAAPASPAAPPSVNNAINDIFEYLHVKFYSIVYYFSRFFKSLTKKTQKNNNLPKTYVLKRPIKCDKI
jgi:hypothetical protein